MSIVKRFDKGSFSEAIKTPQGFLRAPAFLTRTGVLTYRTPSGETRRELRKPEDVFDAESLKTLSAIPVTNDHPPEMLTADNAKKYMVGYTSDAVEKAGDKLKSFLTLTDAAAILAAEGGKQQISCGYFADLDETPGVWQGEPYDAIQRNIRYNHVAMVDRGRAGPEVKMRLDSKDAVVTDADKPPTEVQTLILSKESFPTKETAVKWVGEHDFKVTKEPDETEESWRFRQVAPTSFVAKSFRTIDITAGVKAVVGHKDEQPTGETAQKPMENQQMKIMLNGVEFEVSPELHAALMAEMEKMKGMGMEDGKKEMAADMEKKDQELAKVQAKCDGLEADLKARIDSAQVDPAKVAEAVKARLAVEKVAVRFLKEEKLDALTDSEIKAKVIKAHSPDANLEGKSEAYVDARFDHISETLVASDKKAAELGAVTTTPRNDVASDLDARKKMKEESLNAWKTPLSANKG